MTVKANISRQYLIRMGIIVLAGVGMALWSLYDGLVTYPNQRVRALKFIELKNEGRLAEWKEIANEQGWEPKNPGPPKGKGDIYSQYLMAALAGPVGLLFGCKILLASRRWIAADEEGLSTNSGLKIAYEQITTFSKKHWRTKGIAHVRYQQENRQKRLVLDDYKYDRTATEAIVRRIEAKITPEQIVNGKPEPPLQKAATEEPQATTSQENSADA